MEGIDQITSLEAYNQAILQPAILIFSASWCPDCHFMKTYINDVIEDNKQWHFYYVDRDEMLDLCIDLEILGIPSFVAYKDGKEVSRFVSKLRKTKEEVQDFIDHIE